MPEPEIENPVSIALSPYQARILEAQIKDGCDTYAVGERAGVSRNVANKVLTEIASFFGVKRMEMVVGFIRGRYTYVVR